MTEVAPDEEAAREVGRVVGGVPHIGYYFDQRNVVVVLLPRDASAEGCKRARPDMKSSTCTAT